LDENNKECVPEIFSCNQKFSIVSSGIYLQNRNSLDWPSSTVDC